MANLGTQHLAIGVHRLGFGIDAGRDNSSLGFTLAIDHVKLERVDV